MCALTLYHGSEHIVRKPEFGLGRPYNDYGQGFYCTLDFDLACEWACKGGRDGFVNSYALDTEGLRALDMLDGKHSILNWIAILLAHRTFSLTNEIAIDARDYLIEHFGIDTDRFDIVVGYRADDSYFSFAEVFVENGIPLRKLDEALRLGKLGEQYVLTSPAGINRLEFVEAVPAEGSLYFPRLKARDELARSLWRDRVKPGRTWKDDIFIVDIMREEMDNDDPRIQRVLSE